MRVLILLPTYNESENLRPLCGAILKTVPDANILVVDDNSPDGTGNIADGLAAENKGRIFVRHRAGKEGLGSAIVTGFEFAIKNSYDFVVNMDCDFSHNPAELPQMLNAAKNSDLVIGSRHIGNGHVVGWGKSRILLHWLSRKYADLMLGNYVSDHTNSYRAYRVSMLSGLPLRRTLAAGSGFVWLALFAHEIHRRGFKISEVPSVIAYRQKGQSKMSKKEIFGGLWAILKTKFFNVAD